MIKHPILSSTYYSRHSCSFLVVALLLVACKSEQLTEPPVIISVITTGQEHGDGAHAIAGKSSNIQIISSDDLQLKELRCTCTSSGEYHSHALHGGGLIPAFRAPNIGEWTDVKMKTLDSTYNKSTLKFSIPENLSGLWKLTTAVMDNHGYVSYHEMNVVIENDSIPAIIPVATWPESNPDGIIRIRPGESFGIQGNILDENFLESIVLKIVKDDEIFWLETLHPVNQWMFNLGNLAMPVFEEEGQYELTVLVTDRNNWQNWVNASVIVTND
jgi:hypothetical protein